MFEILVFGTLWFWLLFITVIGLIMYQIEKKSDPFGSTFYLAVFIALAWWLGNGEFFKGVFTWIYQNPGAIIIYSILYLVTGLIWSFAKWYFFII